MAVATTSESTKEAELEPITRIARDLLNASRLLTLSEARYLVDTYYEVQDFRIQAAAQIRSRAVEGEETEPNQFVAWTFESMRVVEATIQRALDRYSSECVEGRWAKSICGIGPVLASGLLAHIEAEKAITAGDIWRFAGLDPSSQWGKGEKRPFNAWLKVLAWKCGESFVKVQNNPNDVYGKVYATRKELEIERNEAGLFADQAAAKLEKYRIGKTTEAYKYYSAGKLPPAHIHARAKRYAVKLFLSHYQHVLHETHFGTPPPKPYILTDPRHTHFIAPPNWPLE